MAAKNGCNEAAKLLLSRGAFVEAKANVKHPFSFPAFTRFKVVESTDIFIEFMFERGLLRVCCVEWNDSLASCCLAFLTIRQLLDCEDRTRV